MANKPDPQKDQANNSGKDHISGLEAFSIFQEEMEKRRSEQRPYSDREWILFQKMELHIKEFILTYHADQMRFASPNQDLEYFKEKEDQYWEDKRRYEMEPDFPPLIFFTNHKGAYHFFDQRVEWMISPTGEGEAFLLFLAFHLRNLSPRMLGNRLEELSTQYPDTFVEDVKLTLAEYPDLIPEGRRELIGQQLNYDQPINKDKPTPKEKTTPSEFTVHRQLLAIYYLLDELGVTFEHVDKTKVSRMAQLLTGRESDIEKTQNTYVYRSLKKMFSRSEKVIKEDLAFIIPYFKELGLEKIVEKICNDFDI